MGVCLSTRRSMQQQSIDDNVSTASNCSSQVPSITATSNKPHQLQHSEGSAVSCKKISNLLLESPRISTDIAEMGMFSLLFHKNYSSSCKSARSKGAPPLNKNIITASQKAHENLLADMYPTFELHSAKKNEQKAPTVSAPVEAKEIKSKQAMWLSAGEDFFCDWEDRGKDGNPLAEEIGVFKAEKYFKEEEEEQRPSDGSCFFDADEEEIAAPPRASSSSSDSQRKKQHKGSKSPKVSWAPSCANSSAVEIEVRNDTKSDNVSKIFKFNTPKRLNRSRSDSSSSKSPRCSSKDQAEGKNISENTVKDWMDRAKKNPAKEQTFSFASNATLAGEPESSAPAPVQTGNVSSVSKSAKEGFGSPFPASPNSDDTKPRPEDQGGMDSDSSSELFEIDSITTTLSSARSSLSRLSSARSSIRKSTAEEHDRIEAPATNVLEATLRVNVVEADGNFKKVKHEQQQANKDQKLATALMMMLPKMEEDAAFARKKKMRGMSCNQGIDEENTPPLKPMKNSSIATSSGSTFIKKIIHQHHLHHHSRRNSGETQERGTVVETS